MKFVKRGFGRGTDFASADVRQGLLTREDGFELAKEYDAPEPGMLDYYLEKTGISKDEFYKVLKEMRSIDFEEKGNSNE
jgi:histidinol phosphatase-like enzyme